MILKCILTDIHSVLAVHLIALMPFLIDLILYVSARYLEVVLFQNLLHDVLVMDLFLNKSTKTTTYQLFKVKLNQLLRMIFVDEVYLLR